MMRRLAGPVALEMTLIIGSILLAFAIDAAWDGREERQREHELLQALQFDFESNRTLLDEAVGMHEDHRAAALAFLERAAPGGVVRAGAIDDADLIGLVSWHTYDPALGSLNSAIASGQLVLIRDDALRNALAGWVDSVEDLNELEIVDRGHALRFADVAFEFVPFRSAVYRLGGGFDRPSTAEADYRGLLRSLLAENIATNRVAEIGFILEDLERVRRQLDEILSLIDTRL